MKRIGQKGVGWKGAGRKVGLPLDIVPRPNHRVIGGRWVYTIKQNDQQEVFRARYAAKGFSQIPDLDHSETFSPFRSLTARLSSIHLVDWLESNTYISKNDQYRCHQSDFKVLKKTSGILDTHELRMIKQKYRTLKNHQELKLSYKRLHFFFPQLFFS